MREDELYRDAYYETRHDRTVYSAQTILAFVLDLIPEVTSAVDVGCGVGTWLYVLQMHGVSEIVGVDGPWVNREHLRIPEEHFIEADLTNGLDVDQQFDLALSLEVAEHLPETSASLFVESLTKLADVVVFSAAIPYQGGTGHINEQWPDYWAQLFEEQGFTPLDVLRRKIWNDEEIPYWYRQNIILYARYPDHLNLPVMSEDYRKPIRMVHPEKYVVVEESVETPRKAFRRFLGALRRSVV